MAARGRPRNFDLSVALERAMLTFWEHGYEGTGVDELAGAMRISVSSLYATFGGKEELFLSALDHYQNDRGDYTKSTMEQAGTAREAFTGLFERAAVELTRADQPRGCMLALAIPSCSPEIEPLRAKVNERRGRSLKRFTQRLRTGQATGEIPLATNVNALARFFITTLQGMSVQARTGATRQQLQQVGCLAMQAWPATTLQPQEPAIRSRARRHPQSL